MFRLSLNGGVGVLVKDVCMALVCVAMMCLVVGLAPSSLADNTRGQTQILLDGEVVEGATLAGNTIPWHYRVNFWLRDLRDLRQNVPEIYSISLAEIGFDPRSDQERALLEALGDPLFEPGEPRQAGEKSRRQGPAEARQQELDQARALGKVYRRLVTALEAAGFDEARLEAVIEAHDPGTITFLDGPVPEADLYEELAVFEGIVTEGAVNEGGAL